VSSGYQSVDGFPFARCQVAGRLQRELLTDRQHELAGKALVSGGPEVGQSNEDGPHIPPDGIDAETGSRIVVDGEWGRRKRVDPQVCPF
jgi:hypothetical protein